MLPGKASVAALCRTEARRPCKDACSASTRNWRHPCSLHVAKTTWNDLLPNRDDMSRRQDFFWSFGLDYRWLCNAGDETSHSILRVSSRGTPSLSCVLVLCATRTPLSWLTTFAGDCSPCPGGAICLIQFRHSSSIPEDISLMLMFGFMFHCRSPGIFH